MDLFSDGKSAVISLCEKYRYTLSRIWNENKYYVNFVGLNPSTADAMNDDPTVRRCIAFAEKWGYGGIVITNLFALRATDPKVMMAYENPVGIDNEKWLREVAREAGLVIVAWGVNGNHLNRDNEVLPMLNSPSCLDITKGGYPKHPLYIKADTNPILYVRS